MKTSQRYLVTVLASGWVILVACSVILFWAKYHTWQGFAERSELVICVRPSGLVPEEIERDPNVKAPSTASATSYRSVQDTLWLRYQDRITWSDGGDWPIVSVVYGAQGEWSRLMYWDERSGLFVHRMISHVPGSKRLVLQSHLYAGPEGISERPGKELGRFTRPIALYKWQIYQQRRWSGLAYDSSTRQCYRIDWDNKKVLKGPMIAEGIELVQLCPYGQKGAIHLEWTPPMRMIREGETSNRGDELIPIEPNMERFTTDQVMVLDREGTLYRLDVETLTLSSPIGSLPVVGPRSSNSPHDLLAYGIRPVEIRGQYTGCVVAAVGAEGMTLKMEVFDKDGRHPVTAGPTYEDPPFEEHPRASAVQAIQYLLECLHPLSLSLLSRAIGPQIEALAGHMGLFVLPNSFVATRARQQDSYPIDRLYWTVVMLLPAMVLAGFLAWRAAKDATTIGLSRTATRWWIFGIAAFGLPAYITYRLTRPQAGLVTCANCGNPRRSDMERCHRCRAPWLMPDLTAPTWRVMD